MKWEGGYKLNAYKCPAGLWTISAGLTYYPETRQKVKEGDTVTQEQAVDMFLDMLKEFELKVKKAVKVDLTDNQFSALVSFTFNCGAGNLQRSTLLKKVNAGDLDGAAAEFEKWNKAGGKVLRGLTNRRREERELFLS